MIGYRFDVTCGHCSSPLEHVNGGPAVGPAVASEVVAVARCVSCGREWAVTVILRPIASKAGERKAEWRVRHRERVSA